MTFQGCGCRLQGWYDRDCRFKVLSVSRGRCNGSSTAETIREAKMTETEMSLAKAPPYLKFSVIHVTLR